MALDQSALFELLGELQDTDVSDRIGISTQKLYQELIDAEAAAVISADPFDRIPDRIVHRNGTRPKTLTTTAGQLDLRIPKLRRGSFFPSLLERRRQVDQALFAVVMKTYVHGVSTGKVNHLVRALGADTGISESEFHASARTSTRTSPRSPAGRWARQRIRMCSSMPTLVWAIAQMHRRGA